MAPSESSASAKKVRKAAKAGGSGAKAHRERRLGFPLAVATVCLLGVALVAVSRVENAEEASARPQLDDHWHAAYGIYDCDHWISTPLADTQPDTTGLHTHEDFLIHIHPFTSRVAGDNATLDRWGELVGLELSDDAIRVNSGGLELEREAGDECGDQPGEVALKVWRVLDDDGNPLLDDEGQPRTSENPALVRRFQDIGDFSPNDRDVIAIIFAPEDDIDDIDQPPTAARLEDPTATEEGREVVPLEGFEAPDTEAFFPPESAEDGESVPINPPEGPVEGDGDDQSEPGPAPEPSEEPSGAAGSDE